MTLLGLQSTSLEQNSRVQSTTNMTSLLPVMPNQVIQTAQDRLHKFKANVLHVLFLSLIGIAIIE